MAENAALDLTKKDFESDQEVRWCPGCGDYSVLAAVQRLLPKLGTPRENHVFVSGIGCSARFPYYMNTYGFHTIHGRAPAIATGLKLTRPELTVWVITGDGDSLSIGGNHLMHMCRRNLDVNILMFNNRIYGLTKGQYSPTSERGKVTKSTPMGSVDHPVNPLAFVLSCGASFVGRCLDVDAKNLMEVIERAVQHRGTSFVEIFQNCNVFNDRTHAHMSERSVRKERQVHLVDGELAVFGDAQDKVLAIERDGPLVLQRNALSTESPELHYRVDCFAHAMTMATLDPESFPIPMGVLYQKERETFDHAARSQVIEAIERRGAGDLEQLVYGGDTWTVDG